MSLPRPFMGLLLLSCVSAINDLHPFSLAGEPHVDAPAIGLSGHGVDTIPLREDSRRGETIQYGLHRWAGVGKGDPPQGSGVHELHPFPEFSVLEPVPVGYGEMVPRPFHLAHAVHPENGGIVLFFLLVGHQVKIELRKQESHRLHPVMFHGPVLPPVGKMDNFFSSYEKGQVPQGIQQLPAMLQGHVAEGFIPDDVLHHVPVLRRALGEELVQYAMELLFPEGPAFEENLCESQYFPLVQMFIGRMDQLVSLLAPVIPDGCMTTLPVGVCQEIPELIHIPLDGLLCHSVVQGQFLLPHHFTPEEPVIYGQEPLPLAFTLFHKMPPFPSSIQRHMDILWDFERVTLFS